MSDLLKNVSNTINELKSMGGDLGAIEGLLINDQDWKDLIDSRQHLFPVQDISDDDSSQHYLLYGVKIIVSAFVPRGQVFKVPKNDAVNIFSSNTSNLFKAPFNPQPAVGVGDPFWDDQIDLGIGPYTQACSGSLNIPNSTSEIAKNMQEAMKQVEAVIDEPLPPKKKKKKKKRHSTKRKIKLDDKKAGGSSVGRASH